MSNEITVLGEVLGRIKALHPKVIDLSLGRIERLLSDLGSPHLQLPSVVHVAGTNGKGSTIAFMRAVLEGSGYKVNTYTSPHLVSFTERIRLDGDLVNATFLADLISHVEVVNGGAPITFFEITTAAAFMAFAQNPADVLLLETGLGGRLDATNVVPQPQAAVLTPISMDHMSYLGNSLSAIAAEKAAIIKPGVPCISAEQQADSTLIIEEFAAKLGTKVAFQGRDWTIEEDQAGRVHYADASTEWIVPRPHLAGQHQILNLGVALATLARLGVNITSSGLCTGMREVEWPARCQQITSGPLVHELRMGWELWLDGGHNPSAGQALAAWLADGAVPTVIICGMMANKDIGGFISPFVSYVKAFIAIPIPYHEGCAKPEELAAIAADSGVAITAVAATAKNALAWSQTHLNADRVRVLICGSLYLAGDVLISHA